MIEIKFQKENNSRTKIKTLVTLIYKLEFL
jgi:hypothetical protein